MLINDEVIVTVALAHWCYRTRKGKPRWILKHSANHHSDLVVLARFDEKSEKISDYLLMPGVALDNPQQLIMDSNHLEIDSFRSESLSSLAALFARQSLASGLTSRRPCPDLAPVHRAPTIKLPALQAPRSSVRNAAAKILLKSFERQSKRMVSFIEKCHSIAERQRKLENTLQFLFSDRSFCKILFDENLDALPAIVAKRMSQ